jgi:hypothetical protein
MILLDTDLSSIGIDTGNPEYKSVAGDKLAYIEMKRDKMVKEIKKDDTENIK